MTDAAVLTDRFDRALLYATHVHGGQVRKATFVPYIAHLLAVAATVLEYNGSEDMAIAALLHDAVEDQGGEPRLSDTRNDWHTRKTRYVEHLSLVDQETLLVSLSDKVHNARSILRDLRKPEIGEAVWGRFRNSKKDTLWNYRELAKAFVKHLPGQLANELSDVVDELEKE
jgi:(p)ppGpp synthase/HD superfamily hydrolase